MNANSNIDSTIYEREDVKRVMAQLDALHERIEAGETDQPEQCAWVTNLGHRLFCLDADDRLSEPATCIYSPADGGKLL